MQASAEASAAFGHNCCLACDVADVGSDVLDADWRRNVAVVAAVGTLAFGGYDQTEVQRTLLLAVDAGSGTSASSTDDVLAEILDASSSAHLGLG